MLARQQLQRECCSIQDLRDILVNIYLGENVFYTSVEAMNFRKLKVLIHFYHIMTHVYTDIYHFVILIWPVDWVYQTLQQCQGLNSYYPVCVCVQGCSTCVILHVSCDIHHKIWPWILSKNTFPNLPPSPFQDIACKNITRSPCRHQSLD